MKKILIDILVMILCICLFACAKDKDEVETTAEAMTSLIEPLLMVVLGGIIAVLVIAMYLPIFGLASASTGCASMRCRTCTKRKVRTAKTCRPRTPF